MHILDKSDKSCLQQRNIKYVLIFDNYKLENTNIININGEKYIPINNKEFDKMEPQYAIIKTGGNLQIKERYAEKLSYDISKREDYINYFLTAFIENDSNDKKVKYYFNTCDLKDEVKILSFDQKKFDQLSIDLIERYDYHVYLNLLGTYIPNQNNIKYFVVITERGSKDIIQILNNKIKQDDYTKPNVFFYYINNGFNNKKYNMKIQQCKWNGSDTLEDYDSTASAPAVVATTEPAVVAPTEPVVVVATEPPVVAPVTQSAGNPKLKMVVDSNGLAKQLYPTLHTILNLGFTTLYAKEENNNKQIRYEYNIQKLEKKDNKQYIRKPASIKNEIDKFYENNTDLSKVPFLIYIDDSPELIGDTNGNDYNIHYGKYGNSDELINIDPVLKSKQTASLTKIPEDLTNINFVVIKLPKNQTGILGQSDVLNNLIELVQKIKEADKDLLFISDFDCTITTLHLWGFYHNQIVPNNILGKYEKMDAIERVGNPPPETFFFEINNTNGAENKEKLKKLFQTIYDIYKS
jgi:hypothetical protein